MMTGKPMVVSEIFSSSIVVVDIINWFSSSKLSTRLNHWKFSSTWEVNLQEKYCRQNINTREVFPHGNWDTERKFAKK